MMKTVWMRSVAGCLVFAFLGLSVAQLPFTLGTEVAVVADVLNVREAPGTGATRVGRQTKGALGVIMDASPHWADSYWWWFVGYHDGLRGWSAEGDAMMTFLQASDGRLASERSEAEWQARFFSGNVMVNCAEPSMNWSGETLNVGHLERCRRPIWSSSIPGIDGDYPLFLSGDLHSTALGIRHFGSYGVPDGLVSLLGVFDRRIGGNNHYEALLIHLQSRSDGYDGLIARVDGQAFRESVGTGFIQIEVGTYIPLPGDGYLTPSIAIWSTFELTQRSLTLTSREVEINEEGMLARSLARPHAQHGGTFAAADVARVVNGVTNAALHSATTSDFEHSLRQLENAYGIELLTTAVRVLPIYDSRAGSWQSFDSWARSEAQRSGVDAPFTRDPVGSTVSILLNPTAGNISRQLGLGDLPW